MTQERTFRKIRIDKCARDFLRKAGIENASMIPIKATQGQIDKLVALLEETPKEQFPTLRITTAQDGDNIYIITLGSDSTAAKQCTEIMRSNPDSGWQNMELRTPFCRSIPFFVFACA
jgi:hypothetical protein